MNSSVVCINETERLSKVVEVNRYLKTSNFNLILRTTNHNGFPVVERESDERPCTYKGFIERKMLLILLERKLYHANYDRPPGLLISESTLMY